MGEKVARKAKRAARGAQSEAAAEPPIGSALVALLGVVDADHERRRARARRFAAWGLAIDLRRVATDEHDARLATLAEHLAAMLEAPPNAAQRSALREACNALAPKGNADRSPFVGPARKQAREAVLRAAKSFAAKLSRDDVRAEQEAAFTRGERASGSWWRLQCAAEDLRAAEPENAGAVDFDAFEITVREMVRETLPRTSRGGAQSGARSWPDRIAVAVLRYLVGFSPKSADNAVRSLASLSQK